MRKPVDDPSFQHGIAWWSLLSSRLISLKGCCSLTFITKEWNSLGKNLTKRCSHFRTSYLDWENPLKNIISDKWEQIILKSVLKAICSGSTQQIQCLATSSAFRVLPVPCRIQIASSDEVRQFIYANCYLVFNHATGALATQKPGVSWITEETKVSWSIRSKLNLCNGFRELWKLYFTKKKLLIATKGFKTVKRSEYVIYSIVKPTFILECKLYNLH